MGGSRVPARTGGWLSEHIGVLALVVLLVGGWFVLGGISATSTTIAVLALYYAIAALSFNFLYGSLGVFSIAQPVFVAVGGYTSVYLWNTYGVSPWFSLLIAPVFAMVLALPVALVATRIGGGAIITALITLIVAEAVPAILIAINPLGGAIGLYPKGATSGSFSAMQYSSGVDFTRILLVINVIVIGGWMWFRHSRLGMYATAVKESPSGAEAAGVATAKVRLLVFLAAAAVAAPAGVVFAQYNLQTTSDLFLGNTPLFQILVIALVGGAARPWGALVGGVIITYIAEKVSDLSTNPAIEPLTFAAVFVIMALIVPRGLSGTWARIVDSRRPKIVGSLTQPETTHHDGLLPNTAAPYTAGHTTAEPTASKASKAVPTHNQPSA